MALPAFADRRGGAARDSLRVRELTAAREPALGREGLTIEWRGWVRILTATTVALLALSVAASVLEYIGVERYSYTLHQLATHFDVDIEGSAPTWFSTLLLFFAASQLLVIGHLRRRERRGWGGYWTVLGAIFVLLSLDEIAGFHNTPYVSEETARAMSAFFAIPWVLQGIAVVAVFAATYLRFLLALPRSTMLGFLRAGLVYVGGALVMEMIGAYFIVHLGDRHPLVRAIITLEEGMEMFGVILLVATLFRYIEREFPRLGVALAPGTPARP